PAGRDDDVLLAVGDPDEARGVDLPDVPRVQPPVRLDHLPGRLGRVVVSLHDVWAAYQDLPVRGDLHLATGHRRPDGADPGAPGRIDRGPAGGLGQSVPLEH